MEVAEGFLKHVCTRILEDYWEDLEQLGRRLRVPRTPLQEDKLQRGTRDPRQAWV